MITAKAGSSIEYELPPEGTHLARCFKLVDLGTQTSDYQGKQIVARKVWIEFELPNELKVFNEAKGEQPFTASKEISVSLHKKANLRKLLESWRGKPFSDEELGGFDLSKLLGKPCMINIIHRKSAQSDNERAEITSVTSIPKGTIMPPQHNDNFEFSLETFSQTMYDALPDWIKDKIKVSPEYKALFNPQQMNSVPLAPGNVRDGFNSKPPIEEDLPF